MKTRLFFGMEIKRAAYFAVDQLRMEYVVGVYIGISLISFILSLCVGDFWGQS